MTHLIENGNDIIGIPIRGGISEGGLIIIAIAVCILALLILAITVVWKFGQDIRSAIRMVKADAAEAKIQVANSHSSNLRDDLDGKHEEIQNAIKELSEDLTDHSLNVNSRFDRMNDRISGVDQRISNLESRKTHE